MYSSVLPVLAAQVPDQPQNVVTQAGDGEIIVSWSVDDRGSLVSAFDVKIRETDGLTYTSESLICQPSDTVILAELKCSIPISTLITAPYNLPYGSSIYA